MVWYHMVVVPQHCFFLERHHLIRGRYGTIAVVMVCGGIFFWKSSSFAKGTKILRMVWYRALTKLFIFVVASFYRTMVWYHTYIQIHTYRSAKASDRARSDVTQSGSEVWCVICGMAPYFPHRWPAPRGKNIPCLVPCMVVWHHTMYPTGAKKLSSLGVENQPGATKPVTAAATIWYHTNQPRCM